MNVIYILSIRGAKMNNLSRFWLILKVYTWLVLTNSWGVTGAVLALINVDTLVDGEDIAGLTLTFGDMVACRTPEKNKVKYLIMYL